MGASYVPFRQSRARKNRKPAQAGASESKIGLEPAKKSSPLRVPPGKIVQAQALLVQGHSQREIGRTLHISPMTVAKIIKADEFQEFIKRQQEKLFAIAPAAIESLRAQVAIDGHLAYALLKDLGIIPSREAMISLMNSTPTAEESGEERQCRLVASVLLESHRNFNINLPKSVEQALAQDSLEHEHGTTPGPAPHLADDGNLV